MCKRGPADVPDDGEEDDRDDVDGAGQLPQPVVWVDHRDVTLNLSIITIIIIMTCLRCNQRLSSLELD